MGSQQESNLESNPLDTANPISAARAIRIRPLPVGPIRNDQSALYTKSSDAGSKTRGLRVDLQYRIGNHELTGGIDNMYFQGHNEGQAMTGPGYAWIYGRVDPASSPNRAISPRGGNGYFVYEVHLLHDHQHVGQAEGLLSGGPLAGHAERLVTLGIRNDKFTNYNSAAKPYVDSGDQWAPRLGASWDVFGDSSLKVFANLGRYYLALPNSVAIRGASASTFTREYFTYSGIDANGNRPG
jgi:hypothetical protein